MPRKVFKKITPSQKIIREQKALKIFGDNLYEKKLWSSKRKEVTLAFLIGLFIAFIPIPFQMVISAFLAILIKANLPLSIILVWITNPFTMPFIFYIEYYIGCLILKIEPITFSNFNLEGSLGDIALSLYTGGFLTAIILSVSCYFFLNMFWVYIIKKRFEMRRS